MRMFVMATAAAALLAGSVVANAQSVSGTVGGAATGAVIGSVAGPPGAIVGGVIGAGVGNTIGPRDTRGYRSYARGSRVCWRDMQGVRHCRWR